MTASAQNAAPPAEEIKFTGKERSLWTDAFRRFSRNKLSMAVSVLVLALIFIAVFAPWLAPTHYDRQVYDRAWEFPSTRHWMGTDQYGRDVLSRIIYGARISLSVALVVNAVSLLIGAPYGAIAGWFGGKVDYALMRFLDVMSAFPNLLLAILMMTILGSGLVNVFIAMSVTSWIGIARLIRGQILSLREQDYIMASRALGASNWRIISRHLIPNSLVPVIVALTLGVPNAIMGEAGLSFLGIGVNAPMPSWGKMLNEYMGSISSSWYLSVFPAIMIALTMYAFTLMGDGLQDALNPTASKNA